MYGGRTKSVSNNKFCTHACRKFNTFLGIQVCTLISYPAHKMYTKQFLKYSISFQDSKVLPTLLMNYSKIRKYIRNLPLINSWFNYACFILV
jgi:hypothetical protein